MMAMNRLTGAAASLFVVGSALAQVPPACRLDSAGADAAASTIRLALKAYSELGTPMPFDQVVANPVAPASSDKTLALYVIKDASTSTVGNDKCIAHTPALVKGEELDSVSVRGGCIASASKLEVQCSSQAVQMFGRQGERPGLSNPALLYVLAHEMWHIKQKRPGEYSGRVQRIDLKQSQATKLQALRDSCDPGETAAEEDADANAVRVLAKLLPEPPYREPLFSPQGSVLWGADQINLAANAWRQTALEREFISQPKPHKSFVATELPASASLVNANAKAFVCEVLTRQGGSVAYPGRGVKHPPLEVRMQRVAETLRPVAAQLPKAGAKQEYHAIAVAQEQLSDIFTFMYRENGKYLDALQSSICTRVNSDKPMAGCAAK